ncbi:MAG: hypothetical protein E7Z85_08245 [Methanosphaera stadtmanae]|nr:hypothetical protein [Methanosphaera stadtmanae]
MPGEIIDDNFLKMDDDFNQYIKYLRLIFTDYNEVVEKFDNIIEKNVFDKQTYVELTGIIKYTSKRVFPLLSAFFGQDENFEEDIYHEFMDIQLMVLYLFDKLQYELDEIILKWNLNDAVIYDEIINMESVNYLLKLIMPQLSLFVNVFDLKIQLVEGSITDTEFENKIVEIHDNMFF